MRALFACLATATLSLPATPQSFNVDFEAIPNPYGPISPSHGGAAPSPGVWNSVSTSPVSGLMALDGTPTGVVLTRDLAGGFGHQSMGATGDLGAVLNDYATGVGMLGQIRWTFSQLAPGDYAVYTICRTPTPSNVLQVTVVGSPDGLQEVWADTDAYGEGDNYTLHHVTVSDGTITLNVSTGGHSPSDNVLNALQLVSAAEPLGDPLCYGDGTGAGCPCANSGGPGRGCDNSSGTAGALLSAWGTISPDTVVLRSTGELPSSLTIFLQGTAAITPVPFGDGIRCTGGPLFRLYVKNATSGVAVAPGAGDPSITARAAALGQQIDPGDRRYYQAYYRDANASFCPPPQGANFNASQMLKIVW